MDAGIPRIINLMSNGMCDATMNRLFATGDGPVVYPEQQGTDRRGEFTAPISRKPPKTTPIATHLMGRAHIASVKFGQSDVTYESVHLQASLVFVGGGGGVQQTQLTTLVAEACSGCSMQHSPQRCHSIVTATMGILVNNKNL